MSKPLLAVDFDGTLTSDRATTWPLRNLDLSLVRKAVNRGWAVQIFTANDQLDRIAHELGKRGIHAYVDHKMTHQDWNGGRDGRTVIISQRKMWVRAILDDRAYNFRYGDSADDMLDGLEPVRKLRAAA